jgi:hypothetical protein
VKLNNALIININCKVDRAMDSLGEFKFKVQGSVARGMAVREPILRACTEAQGRSPPALTTIDHDGRRKGRQAGGKAGDRKSPRTEPTIAAERETPREREMGPWRHGGKVKRRH